MIDRVHDEQYMRAALVAARKGIGKTSPNPAVGAVLVRGRRVLATGWHRAAGLPHAEIEALHKAGDAWGATLYVTLEPCSTHGRTPPCTDAIIAAGVRRVVIGAIDPNPRHAGRALAILREAGIAVTTGVLEAECRALNAAFNKWITTGMPLVIAKAALSLDGRLVLPPTAGRWLTCREARRHAHALRAQVDAILIGAGTLRADNPRLTVRGIRGARQPWRVVLTRSGTLPAGARLFTDRHRSRTLVLRGRRSLRAVLRELGRRQITSVLLEGGATVLGQAFDNRLVDRVQFYLAPLLAGGPSACPGGCRQRSIADAAWLEDPHYEKVGADLVVTGVVRRNAVPKQPPSMAC